MALRVGLIGCGGIAGAHLRGWLGVGARAEIVALADPDPAARWRRRTQLNGTPNGKLRPTTVLEFDGFEELIERAKPDVIDICLPHHLHKPCIVRACGAKVHWLCEKPLCLDRAEAEAIREAMRSAGVVGMCAHNQIFLPAVAEARRLLSGGALGRVYRIESNDCFIMGLPPVGSLPGTPGESPVAAGSWRADRRRMGGGELIDTGYHPAYRLLYLAGERPTRVCAMVARHRMSQMDGEDTATVLCSFPSGASGQVFTSWAMEIPTGQHLIHVVGERGELYGGPSDLWFQPTRMEPARMRLPEKDTFAAEIEHFVTCVETGRAPVQTVEDGIAALEFILDAYAAAGA